MKFWMAEPCFKAMQYACQKPGFSGLASLLLSPSRSSIDMGCACVIIHAFLHRFFGLLAWYSIFKPLLKPWKKAPPIFCRFGQRFRPVWLVSRNSQTIFGTAGIVPLGRCSRVCIRVYGKLPGKAPKHF